MRSDDLYSLPEGLPVPVDDGAARHLVGMRVPCVVLPSTSGASVDLSALGPGRTVLYAYPRTGEPDRDPPPGWDDVPGARGCTPQACAYRDHHDLIRDLGARVYAVSTQETAYQKEMAERLHLPFEVLSDARGRLRREMRLPSMTIAGHALLKRLTMMIRDGAVEEVFYPVFPPNADAPRVVAWLRERGGD